MTENSSMHAPDADRTGSGRFKEDDNQTTDRQNANDNICKGQGDDRQSQPTTTGAATGRDLIGIGKTSVIGYQRSA